MGMIKQLSIIAVLIVVTPAATTRSQIASLNQQPQEETAIFITAARAFVELLATKKFSDAVAQFDDTMKGAMPEPKLQETWNSVLAQAGAFKQAGKARAEKRGAYTMVFVTCDFQNMPLDIRVVFDQSRRVAGLFITPVTNVDCAPPAYVKSDSFQEKQITVGTGEWTLPATLTIPVGSGPFPAVVLVHGSGPNDRDETLGPNKPFKDLAWGLASRGIAVLRYEKRTKQYPDKIASLHNLTVKEEVIDDVLAAVQLLHKTERIEGKRIFVLGHSLGGMLLPRIGLLDPNIAGLISLAGATRPLEDVIPQQTDLHLFTGRRDFNGESKANRKGKRTVSQG
jgi:dienelactone hydrolase